MPRDFFSANDLYSAIPRTNRAGNLVTGFGKDTEPVQQFSMFDDLSGQMGPIGTVTPELLSIAEQLGISDDRARELANAQFGAKPVSMQAANAELRTKSSGYWDTGQYDRQLSDLSAANTAHATSLSDSYSRGPESIIRNLSLVDDISKIDLSDPYAMRKLGVRGLFEGNTANLDRLVPNRDDWLATGVKTFLPAAIGTLASVIGGPWVGAPIGGALSTAMNQAIQGGQGMASLDLGGIAEGAGMGLVGGAVGQLTSSISNPLLQTGATALGGAGIQALESGELDLENMIMAGSLAGGASLVGNLAQGGYTGYLEDGLDGITRGMWEGGITGAPTQFSDVPAAGTESPSGFSGAEIQAGALPQESIMTPWGTSVLNQTGPGSASLQQITSGNVQDIVNPDLLAAAKASGSFFEDGSGTSLQTDFAGVDAPGVFGDGQLVNRLGIDAINAIISGIIPDEFGRQNSVISDGGVSNGLMSNLLGTGKIDSLSDLQTRGVGL